MGLLKSDQNGIEITTIHQKMNMHETLKSDQNGIEIDQYGVDSPRRTS